MSAQERPNASSDSAALNCRLGTSSPSDESQSGIGARPGSQPFVGHDAGGVVEEGIDEDLFFAEGYVHAQERFWQMEFQRRVASGRLSEIFGETTLSTDKYLRHFNFTALTEQSYAMLDDETRRVVDAYAAGVNAYIENRKPAQLGLEFALLELFMRHPRQVLRRDIIYEKVWGYDFGGESNVIEVYMRYLRSKLEAAGKPRLIHTVRGVGYVLKE